MTDEMIEVFKYRDFQIPIYYDDYGQQFYAIINGKEFGFGAFNTNYKEELKKIIDEKLDTIYLFEDDYPGAKLEWFINGLSNKDIRLKYRTRTIKIFLIENKNNIDINTLIAASKKYLEEYLSKHKTIIETN